MQKYLTLFAISWQNEFIYRINFILWRFRNVVRLLMVYFLWAGIFSINQQVFGYTKNEIFTYVFMILVVSSMVLSTPSADQIGGEISNGDLSNYLVKPISYIKYWFTRDLSSKVLNIIFAAVEITLFWLVFKPEIKPPASLENLLAFFLICIIAVVTYFLIIVSSRFVAFWTPENTWGIAFLVIILLEVLAGGIFPLDVLPKTIQIVLQFTPFPYLLYYPVAIFIGKVTGSALIAILLQSLAWLGIMLLITKFLWKRGLRIYSSEGR